MTIYVEPPTGTATRFSWDNEVFTLNQERTFSGSYTFASAGTYTVWAEIYDINGQQSGWNADNRFDQLTETFTISNPITVQIGSDNYTVDEDDGEAEITVTISASPPESFSVGVRTSDGTAAEFSDYDNSTFSVSFSSGTTTLTQTFTVTIVDDSWVEPDESFTVELQPIIGGLPSSVSLARSEATVKILDDDEATVGFERSSLSVTEANERFEAEVEVESDACPVTVPFEVHMSHTAPDGTSSSGSSVPSSVTFQSCRSRRAFVVDIDDLSGTGSGLLTGTTEAVFTLDRVTSADSGVASRVKIGQSSTMTVTIQDDDEVTVRWERTYGLVREGDQFDDLCVVIPDRSASIGRPFTVHFSYTDPAGALSSPSTIPSSVTFSPGDQKACVNAFDLGDVTSQSASVTFTLDSVTSADSDVASRVTIRDTMSTMELEVVDTGTSLPNRAPTVSRVSPSASSITLETGDSRTFQASATDPDANITSYEWTVKGRGVGNSGTLTDTGDVTRTFSHTFSTAGNYPVKATFTDDEGASASVSWTVVVSDREENTNRAPTVSRVPSTPSSLTLTTGDSWTFTARAIDPENKLKRYEWSVNGVSKDSHTWLLVLPRGAVTEEFAHRFLMYGNYTVTATFTDAEGQSGSVSWDVEVTGPDLTSWVGGNVLTGSKTVYGTCEVSQNEVQAGDHVTLTATVTSDNLTGNVYLSLAFTDNTRGIVSPEDLHMSLKTQSRFISEGGVVTLTQELAAGHAGDYDLSCRLFWELPGEVPDVELENQQQSSTPLAVGGGGNFSGSGRSELTKCGPGPTDMMPLLLPLLAGKNVTLAATGYWGSGDLSGYYSVRAYVYHGGDVVANGFGTKNHTYFTVSIPIFKGQYNFDSLGEYVMDCELYYHPARPSNPFASTTEKLKTGFIALYSPGSAIGGIAGFRGVLTTTFTIADARWGDQQLSIITSPPGDTGEATLPYGGGTVTVRVHTDESTTRQTGVTAPAISIEDPSMPEAPPISERTVSCVTSESTSYTRRCWQTTFEVPENDLFEAKSYTVTASSDHINGTRQGTFAVEALPVDKPVLNALYEATGGPNWHNDTDWLSHAPLDDWHGVDTVMDDRVTGLKLPSNNLSGPIPTVLGDLTGLEVLDLSRNGLTGKIPAAFESLTALTTLDLSGNGLTGEIPAALESLTALITLDLSGNGLTGEIPSGLGDLTALTTLDLSSNDLDGGIPSELGRLTRLEALRLYDNDLNRPIPVELGNLTNLTELDLSGNRLSGWIPAQLDKLTNLQVLDLSDNNRLTGAIPEGLGNLKHLTTVYLSGNSLDSGCIPAIWRDPRDPRNLKNHDLDDVDLPFCDVALSALSVSPGELTPRFDPGVSKYTAEVEDGQVTITPATSHGATFELVDGEGESVPDADGALSGHQIAVGYGDTTIEIRVVSQDGGEHTPTPSGSNGPENPVSRP